MRKVSVLSRKYDGSLRDEYEAFLHAATDEAITLVSPPGTPYYDHRKAAWFAAPDGTIEVYPRREHFNVVHVVEDASRRNRIYVNLALPATLLDGRIEWTDLDLDYRLHFDATVEQLDVDEFVRNTERMGYPPDLVRRVEYTCLEVEKGLAEQRYPFDHARQVALYRRLKHHFGP